MCNKPNQTIYVDFYFYTPPAPPSLTDQFYNFLGMQKPQSQPPPMSETLMRIFTTKSGLSPRVLKIIHGAANFLTKTLKEDSLSVLTQVGESSFLFYLERDDSGDKKILQPADFRTLQTVFGSVFNFKIESGEINFDRLPPGITVTDEGRQNLILMAQHDDKSTLRRWELFADYIRQPSLHEGAVRTNERILVVEPHMLVTNEGHRRRPEG